MHYRPPIRYSRRYYLPVLFGLTLIALLIPQRYTNKLISLVQVIVPVQDAAASLIGIHGDNTSEVEGPVSRSAYDALERENAALAHQTAALAMRVADLEKDVSILTAARMSGIGGATLGARGRLIPARVIVDDLMSWRSSRLLNAGSLQGVHDGAPVTSRYFTLGEGENAAIRDGMAVLLGEVLIGMVEQAGTHTSRMKLVSDVTVQMKVRIGRLGDDGFRSLEPFYWLTGHGSGVMQVRDALQRDVADGLLAVGDIVLSDQASQTLPASMTIGFVTAIATDPKNPLLSILTIHSAVDVSQLRRVFVYDSGL